MHFALLSLVLAAPPTIEVTTTADVVANDGECSLREAINAINTGTTVDTCVCSGGNGWRILLMEGTFTLTLTGAPEDANASGDLDVGPSVGSIQGYGPRATIVDGGLADRVFDRLGGNSLYLAGVTIRRGVGDGAAIRSFASLTVNNVELRDNDGNAISSSGALAITNATIADNLGSGINAVTGSVTLDTCTISGNDAGASAGAAIFINSPDAALTINNSTITKNRSSAVAGSAIFKNGSDVQIDNVILGDNAGSNECGPAAVTTTRHHNLVSGSCTPNNPTADDNALDADQLLPLDDYGGQTRTHALMVVGVDTGDCGSAIEDQRGVTRPIDNPAIAGTGCDVGAFEAQAYCRVFQRPNNAAFILCPDGSNAAVGGVTGPTGAQGTTGANGAAGTNGSAGDTGATGPSGESALAACSVKDNGDNSATIACPDGTTATLTGGPTKSTGGCQAHGGGAWIVLLALLLVRRRR